MKIVIIIFFSLVAYFCSFSQITFEKIIDEGHCELARCVKQCNDKGYILSGVHYNNATPYFHNMYLVKTDSVGNINWTKDIYWGSMGYSVVPNYEGGYFMLGKIGGEYTTIVVKTDSIGNLIWIKSFENVQGYKMIQSGDNNLVFTGYKIVGSSNTDVYLQKIGYNGSIMWSKTFGYGGCDVAYDIKLTNDNGYIITGESHNGEDYELYVIKTDSSGNILWQKKHNEGFVANAVYQTYDNGYILTGYAYGMLLLKLNNSGNVEWSKILNGFNGFSVIQSNDFGYLVTGKNNNNFYIVKTDSLGNMMWENEFSKGFFGKAEDCIITDDNGFAVAGHFAGDNGYDMYFIKTDSNGCIRPEINNIVGMQNVTVNDTIMFIAKTQFGTETLLYNWDCGIGQIISGQGDDSVKIVWNQIGYDSILLIITNPCGADSMFHNIQIADCVDPVISQIYGDSIVALFNIKDYYVNLLEGTLPVNYSWTVSHGDILSGQNTNLITVEWTSLGFGSINVFATNDCGTGSSSATIYIILANTIESFDDNFKIYPNPSHNGIFNIEFNLKDIYPFEIRIFNINGELIYKQFFKNKTQLDLSDKSKGIYILMINSKNYYKIRKMIII